MDIFSTFDAGDMQIVYYREGDLFAFNMIPLSMQGKRAQHRGSYSDTVAARSISRTLKHGFPSMTPESMVQFKLSGTPMAAEHYPGVSLRNAACTCKLKFLSQEKKGNCIITRFEYETGLFFDHIVELHDRWVRVYTDILNRTDRPVKFDYIASFSLGMLSPFQPDNGAGKYMLHRVRSFWSAEGRYEAESLEHAGMEMSWQAAGLRNVRYGQRSTMPVKEFFPFGALEDTEYHVLWGVQLEAAGAWELEFARACDAVNISGGQPDREFNGWTAVLKPGLHFHSMPAILSCVRGDIQDLFNRLSLSQTEGLTLRKEEKDLPPLFNEYCTTWGSPTQDLLERHIEVLKGMGLRYFMLDAGWYYKKDRGFIGDWRLNEDQYHGSFDSFLDKIRAAGMIPGVWFEFEVALVNSQIARNHPEYMLTLDQAPVQSGPRQFLDLRKEEVRAYLRERVIEFLSKHKIGYMKVDYNASISCGCDGEDSPQENQRQYTMAVRSFFDEIRAALPDLTLEVCSSGGHRLTAEWLRYADIVSFSDAHEGLELPVIALNVQKMIALQKNQIWSVLRPDDSMKRLHYSLAAAMIGRMCLSGDVADLSEKQLSVVREAVDFYKKLTPLIADGESCFEQKIGDVWAEPTGWQMFCRSGKKAQYIVVHTFNQPPEKLSIKLMDGVKSIRHFAADSLSWKIENGNLVIIHPEALEGAAFLFEK